MSFGSRIVATLIGLTLIALISTGARATAPATEIPPATYSVKQLTPEVALLAAQAAQAACRGAGHQAAVAVVDRSGVLLVLLRDRYAGPHTVDAATQKAWTAASFRIATTALAIETQPGKPMSGLRALPRVLAAGGGQPIEAGGSLLGGIGVSGGPGGEADDACALAGLKAINELIEF
jgi:uncharacterized protein GlcG (DUF336 family)